MLGLLSIAIAFTLGWAVKGLISHNYNLESVWYNQGYRDGLDVRYRPPRKER